MKSEVTPTYDVSMPNYENFPNRATTEGYSSVDLTFSILFAYHWQDAEKLERVVLKHCHPYTVDICQGKFSVGFGLQDYKE